MPVADAAQVWEDFNQSLLSFIARRVRDRDTAEDILQEVMLRIHRHRVRHAAIRMDASSHG